MNPALAWQAPAIVAVIAAAAAFPLVADGYYMSLGVTMLNYIVLATAWALFSGPTRYISLATAAFFGIGAYTMAVFSETLSIPAIIALAVAIGVAVAVVVGLATLRLRGMFFVIFTFGLAELIRQLVTWYETKITRTVGRYIFLDITQEQIFWALLALAVLVFIVGFAIQRSRLGLALRVIGDDETVARHVAINTTAAKLVLFAISAAFMAAAGAIMAPRWTYIEPLIVFSPLISFQVVIMALLGGPGRLWGPLVGVVPLVV
ncbi:MAG: branched-chain amino acid ABC transporter permease, partial [Dongiaceae bacterium]